MPETHSCEICGNQAEQFLTGGDYSHQRCPKCGEFQLTGRGSESIGHLSVEDRVKLSGWIRDQNVAGEIPRLTDDRIRRIATGPIPGFVERTDRFLIFALRSLTSLGQRFNYWQPAFQAITYSKDENEVYYLANFLKEQGLIINLEAGYTEITPRGYIRCEELQARQSASAQGFVAMWFDDTTRDAYERGFEVGIREAGYDPLRIDQLEHAGKIDDEIIAQIRRSRFVVADFTGHRGGVYFEAGFALGLNLPVLCTCHQNDMENLHFDIRQFNCIDWGEPSELSTRLKNRIEAVIGVGPRAI